MGLRMSWIISSKLVVGFRVLSLALFSLRVLDRDVQYYVPPDPFSTKVLNLVAMSIYQLEFCF